MLIVLNDARWFDWEHFMDDEGVGNFRSENCSVVVKTKSSFVKFRNCIDSIKLKESLENVCTLENGDSTASETVELRNFSHSEFVVGKINLWDRDDGNIMLSEFFVRSVI